MPQTVRKQLIAKYNICINLYIEQIKLMEKKEVEFFTENPQHYETLMYIKNQLSSSDKKKKKEIFEFVKNTLGSFSETYDVQVMFNIDDYKIIYFITLYFVREDKKIKHDNKLNILFLTLHQIFCRLLISPKPLVILKKFNRFFRVHNYQKIKDEYGDIGYYHIMKSIYLMQKEIYKDLISKDILITDDAFLVNYFKEVSNAK